MKLTEDKYNKIKLSLRLSEIGEVVHICNVKPETVRLVNQCDTYTEYCDSYDFQQLNGQKYTVTNYTNADVIRCVTDNTKQILQALADLENKVKLI